MLHPNRFGAADNSSAPDLLPSVDLLLCAIRGQIDDWVPITRWAWQLGSLYREVIEGRTDSREIRVRIGGVAAEIDRRVAAYLPRPHPGAIPITNSVGGVISTVAEAHECAYWALHHHPSRDVRVLRTWDHLAEMADAYTVLREKILIGGIALPKAWPGVESVHTLR